MWEYSDKVMDHFLHPRNAGDMEEPDAVGQVGSFVCGDSMKLMLKIEGDRIVDARFKTFGCASAIASASAMTELVRGKTVEEALKITAEEIAERLGGLPAAKMHCSVMGTDALRAAVASYRGEPLPESALEEGEIVCECFGITREKIERAIREHGLHEADEVTAFTKAGGACGKCRDKIQEILDSLRPELPEKPAKKLTNLQRMRLVDATIQLDIRPVLRQDGGDMELVDIEGNRVKVALKGACVSCPMSGDTIKQLVQAKLRERVDPEIVVEEVR